ncbi:MAG: glycosyltransferase [Desulfobacterales bacterium]|nr:glycosyltransferase [Desulfobacterales bacterium]
MIIDILVILLGILFSRLLFYNFPLIKTLDSKEGSLKISVIIPARNEGKNLPLLLGDLKRQKINIHEIICIDDDSTDDTAKIALQNYVKLISLKNKPEGWMGKSWACQNGADASEGDVLLFLDADVRLNSEGIRKLMQAYEENCCAISVQPYHKTVNKNEQFSMFFNLIQFAANRLGSPCKSRNIGLYGAVILISKTDYYLAGGHESIKTSIIDDVALGGKLKQIGIPFRLFLGDEDIYFRMYSSGFKELLRGWTKNQAEGAIKTPFIIFIMIFFWIASCTSVAIQLIISILNMDLMWVLIYSITYILWVFELQRISLKIGSFPMSSIIIYPIYLVVYLTVFLLSVVKKVFHLKVVWKEREIRLGK